MARWAEMISSQDPCRAEELMVAKALSFFALATLAEDAVQCHMEHA